MIKSKCGKILISGFPNSGKSTLLNTFFKKKISIVSPKVQTTNDNVRAILNIKNDQLIFIDTPGIVTEKKYLSKKISRAISKNTENININLFVFDITKNITDVKKKFIIDCIEKYKKNFLVLNKIDLVKKDNLLNIINKIDKMFNFSEVFPISAKKKYGLKNLLKKISMNIPEGKWIYKKINEHENIKFEISEITREKIFRLLNKELPYVVIVESDLIYNKKILKIFQKIYVKKESQKAIIIGKNGSKIKDIGSRARIDIEKHLKKKIFLDLKVLLKKKS